MTVSFYSSQLTNAFKDCYKWEFGNFKDEDEDEEQL